MTAALPRSRPKMGRPELIALLTQEHGAEAVRDLGPLFVVGVRGYYRDTLGKVGENDRGLYDDAIFIVVPDGLTAFNGNTDPSRYRPGQGTGAGKGMATLAPGLFKAHHFGRHKGEYDALIQTAGKVTVLRDGASGPYADTGWFGINIHRGGVNTTSSEGCQTLPPAQWPQFIQTMHLEAAHLLGPNWRSKVIPYVLIEVKP